MKINTDKGKIVYFKSNHDIFLQNFDGKLLIMQKCQNPYVNLAHSLDPWHILQILLNFD